MKILWKIIIVLLALSVIPVIIVGYTSVITTKNVGTEISEILEDTLYDQAKDNMKNQAKMLVDRIESQLETYMNDIKLISKHSGIPGLMLETRNTGVLEDTRSDPDVDQSEQVARFYPADKSGLWQKLQDYFISIYNERVKDIDLIRIFYKNGFIVNGVALGEEDIRDYKGDKSWFVDTMDTGQTGSDDYYVSPISIARRTDSPAIRYITPLEAEGERLGLVVINFKSSTITNVIQDFKYGKAGYAMLIDANYENAEGKISDFPVVISEPTIDGSLYYIKEDKGAPISKHSLKENFGFIEFTKNGRKWISAYQKVDWEDKHWYVLINMPEEEITAVVVSTKDSLDDTIDSTKNFLLLMITAFLFIIFVVGYVFANTLSGPIRRLTETGNRIANGSLDVEIPEIKSRDEIQDLGKTMALLVKTIKLLKKEKELNKKNSN